MYEDKKGKQYHLTSTSDYVSQLTALPLRVTQFQVPAGASRVLLGAIRAAQVLDLVVE